MAHAEGLGGGDLDIVDVVAVPHRLEKRVGKAKEKEVLYGLFAEVVVDAINLSLGEGFGDRGVEGVRRRQVAAERLLDDNPRPALLLLVQPGAGQLANDGRGGAGRSG
jgi:hypothetical protein